VLSADVGNKHGFNTHGVVFDELHTQPNRKLYDVMTKGSGDARMQPLYFLITTAGDNQNSICWEKENPPRKSTARSLRLWRWTGLSAAATIQARAFMTSAVCSFFDVYSA
jgi:hypothetical protein